MMPSMSTDATPVTSCPDLSVTEKGILPDTSIESPQSESNEKAPGLMGVTELDCETPEGLSDAGTEVNSLNGQERWNQPRINTFRYLYCNYSFFILGMNDACIGALIPYIEPYYGLDYATVSTLFIAPFVGDVAAALANNYIHYKIGQRGVAMIAPVCKIAAYTTACLHPPFPVIVVLFMLNGFGSGLENSGWNAWVGNMQNANELLGFIHGSYGLGGTIAPLVASAMVAKGGLEWFTFYYIMLGLSVVEFIAGTLAFRRATGAEYRRKLAYDDDNKQRVTTRAVLRKPLPWIVALFIFGYVGSEVSLGGWITSFMIDVRHADSFLAGITVTLFWLGLTIGRVVLGFITGRVGEKLAISCYTLLSIVFLLLYWVIPSFVASAIFVTLDGFFLGPLFPSAIVAAAKLLPAEYHISALGFIGAVGSGGAAVLPFVVGAMAQAEGVQVLQPFILGVLVFILLIWSALPGGYKRGGLDKARREKARIGSDFVIAWRWMTGKLGA